MRDVDQKNGEESTYECYDCGAIRIEESNPEVCPDCGGQMRNRMMPME